MEALPLEAYQFALQNTVDAVAITDKDSVIQWVNPAFTNTTGFTLEEAVGNKPSILKSRHTTLNTYKEMWDTILAGGWWRGEIVNVKKSGEEWYSYLSISQLRDKEGKPFAYIGISRDVTEMRRLQYQIKEAGLEAIFMLSVAAEAKDESTGSHIKRVQRYAQALAKRLGMADMEAEEIGYSSMMHDIGKLHVPDAILKKAGPLVEEEWELMCKHSENGVVILRGKPFYQTARDIAGNHHERWDGTGYHSGKRGEEIPLSARIVALADVYDALTSVRPYKEAWSEEDAIEEIKAQRGKHFDPKIVDVFLSLYEEGVITDIGKQFPHD